MVIERAEDARISTISTMFMTWKTKGRARARRHWPQGASCCTESNVSLPSAHSAPSSARSKLVVAVSCRCVSLLFFSFFFTKFVSVTSFCAPSRALRLSVNCSCASPFSVGLQWLQRIMTRPCIRSMSAMFANKTSRSEPSCCIARSLLISDYDNEV